MYRVCVRESRRNRPSEDLVPKDTMADETTHEDRVSHSPTQYSVASRTVSSFADEVSELIFTTEFVQNMTDLCDNSTQSPAVHIRRHGKLKDGFVILGFCAGVVIVLVILFAFVYRMGYHRRFRTLWHAQQRSESRPMLNMIA